MKPQALQQQITARPEETTFLGRDAVRVPATAVREQVLHNNIGAMYLPEDEIAASADQWDFTPVTLGHPTSRGQPISGRDPDALNDYAVGVFAECSVQDGELKGDVYLWKDRLEEVDGGESVLEALQSREPVEVSTGFGGEFYHEESEFGGESYEVVAQNIGPDHFALLPNGTGACSVEDGCGLGINQSQPEFDGTEDIVPGWVDEGDWDRPNLADHPEADGEDEWSDLSDEDRATIAGRFIEGDADVETYADLGFPVVNPATGNLNRNAVLAARQRGDDTEAGDIADALWDEHFAEDDMDEENAENLLNRFLNRMEELMEGATNQDGMSLDDRREAVSDHIDAQFGATDRFVYVDELFEGEVIYRIDVQGGEDRLFRADYEITEDGEVTLGERTQVEKQVEFVPADNELQQEIEYIPAIAANTEEDDMTPDELRQLLAENEDVPYAEDELEGMDEDQLQFAANAADLDIENEGDAEDEAEETDEPAANASADADEPPAWAEGIMNRLDQLEEATEPVREEQAQKRRRLASEVAQNSAFDEDELEDRSIAELEKLRQSVKPRDFSGLGGPSRMEAGEEQTQFVENSVQGEPAPGN